MEGNNSSTDSMYYCAEFEPAHSRYVALHGYISVCVCVLGAMCNGLSLTVLARPELHSTTSALLGALAAADGLVMLEYVPFALHTYVLTSRPRAARYTYAWAVYVLFHANFTQVFHTISIWLTVMLAVWRFIAVRFPMKNRELCTPRNTSVAIACAYILSPVLCVPLYFAFAITPRVVDASTTLYFMDVSELGRAHGGVLISANFWVYSVLIKLLPCALLTVLSQRLVAALWDNKRRRRSLLNKDDKDGDRTSRLLLAVLFLFLLTELPQGILGLLSMVLGERFFTCYALLGELMDLLALASSAVNFPIYCIMSRQFRTSFTAMVMRATPLRPSRPKSAATASTPCPPDIIDCQGTNRKITQL